MRRGFPVVLAAASGAGKTTIAHRLLDELDRLEFSVSYTTRPRRGRERDGVDYHFVDEATFRRMIDEGAFLEWAEVHGHLYGSGYEATVRRLDEGVDVLFDIDVQGGEQLKSRLPETLLIWIDPPSWRELERRLRSRGTDDEATIRRRLRNAHRERRRALHTFEHVVVNDDLDRAVRACRALVEERRRALERALRPQPACGV